MKQSLDGSLPKMCPAVQPFDQDGPHSRTQLNIGPYGKFTQNLLVWNQLLIWNQTLIKQSLDSPLPKLCLVVPPSDQDDCTAAQDPMGNSNKNHLVWNQQLNQNQTLMEQSLDGPFPKLCPAVALSHQDGHHSAVALLLKAAMIQVSDYRLLGASGYYFTDIQSYHLPQISSYIIYNIILNRKPKTIPQCHYYIHSGIFKFLKKITTRVNFTNESNLYYAYNYKTVLM